MYSGIGQEARQNRAYGWVNSSCVRLDDELNDHGCILAAMRDCGETSCAYTYKSERSDQLLFPSQL